MEKVYSYLDEPECAYLLRNGSVYFEIKEGEIYKITGKNQIVAASEIILNFNPDNYYYRVYNFYKDENTELERISPDNLAKLIMKYGLGFNMNIFFAKMIKITNKILAKRQSKLNDNVKAVQKISMKYYEITNSLLDLGKKTRFPDIVSLGEKLKSELIYETGKIFSRQKPDVQLEVKEEKLDEFNVSYPPNSIICKEGEDGAEMFILNKGIIGVYINDFKVAMIDKPGTVIGEISLLLGEKRTATLKAVNQVVLSVIKKENLPDFHKNHQDVFFQIGETLSQRLYNNFDLIQKIDEQIHEKPIEKVGGFLTIDRAKLKLNELKSELNTLYNTKRYEQLPELINLAEGS